MAPRCVSANVSDMNLIVNDRTRSFSTNCNQNLPSWWVSVTTFKLFLFIAFFVWYEHTIRIGVIGMISTCTKGYREAIPPTTPPSLPVVCSHPAPSLRVRCSRLAHVCSATTYRVVPSLVFSMGSGQSAAQGGTIVVEGQQALTSEEEKRRQLYMF